MKDGYMTYRYRIRAEATRSERLARLNILDGRVHIGVSVGICLLLSLKIDIDHVLASWRPHVRIHNPDMGSSVNVTGFASCIYESKIMGGLESMGTLYHRSM